MTCQQEPSAHPTNRQETVMSRLSRRALPLIPKRSVVVLRSSVVVIATVSVAAMLAVSLPVTASVPGQGTPSGVHKSETLRLILRDGPETEVDVNKDGIGPGDYAVKTGSVYMGAKKLGRLTQSCTALTVTPVPSLRCSMDLVLSRGQVTLQGSFTLSDRAPQLAVTGGTGKYEGVQGQLTEPGSQGDDNLISLHLIYPEQT